MCVYVYLYIFVYISICMCVYVCCVFVCICVYVCMSVCACIETLSLYFLLFYGLAIETWGASWDFCVHIHIPVNGTCLFLRSVVALHRHDKDFQSPYQYLILQISFLNFISPFSSPQAVMILNNVYVYFKKPFQAKNLYFFCEG